jgi:hypothetical protein
VVKEPLELLLEGAVEGEEAALPVERADEVAARFEDSLKNLEPRRAGGCGCRVAHYRRADSHPRAGLARARAERDGAKFKG